MIIVVSTSNVMQISVLGGGLDTVSDHQPQVPGFKSMGYLNFFAFFQLSFNRTW